jgi:predicted alpha/beta-fold hydrolase
MPYSYHAGKTEDLDTVFRHIYSQYPQYLEVTAAGYSLGGNLLVKFLGEEKWDTIHRIERAAAISAPANLLAASQTIGSGTNRLLYENRFLRFLRATVRAKWPAMNGLISEAEFAAVKTLKAWDDRITAPLNGFRNAEDYYAQNSCAQFIPAIQTPLYMVTAANDPFFSEPCYPVAEARQNPLLTLEIPQNGGHVGFITFGNKGEFWSETRVGDWLCNGNL